MSFGVGVEDFLAVGRLVLDHYNACKDAPGTVPRNLSRAQLNSHYSFRLAEQAKNLNTRKRVYTRMGANSGEFGIHSR
jgi:hypothetical protein